MLDANSSQTPTGSLSNIPGTPQYVYDLSDDVRWLDDFTIGSVVLRAWSPSRPPRLKLTGMYS